MRTGARKGPERCTTHIRRLYAGQHTTLRREGSSQHFFAGHSCINPSVVLTISYLGYRLRNSLDEGLVPLAYRSIVATLLLRHCYRCQVREIPKCVRSQTTRHQRRLSNNSQAILQVLSQSKRQFLTFQEY